jgi:hypothetical protein
VEVVIFFNYVPAEYQHMLQLHGPTGGQWVTAGLKQHILKAGH